MDGQTDGTDRITTPNTALAQLRRTVKIGIHACLRDRLFDRRFMSWSTFYKPTTRYAANAMPSPASSACINKLTETAAI